MSTNIIQRKYKLTYYLHKLVLIISLVCIYYLMLPVYLIVFWITFFKLVWNWFYISFIKKSLYGVKIDIYLPTKLTWKSYLLVIIQTPQFFAKVRFFKIWTFEKNKHQNWFLSVLVYVTAFIIGLPLHMFRVLRFWYYMYLILTYDWENFEVHYARLQNEYFNFILNFYV